MVANLSFFFSINWHINTAENTGDSFHSPYSCIKDRTGEWRKCQSDLIGHTVLRKDLIVYGVDISYSAKIQQMKMNGMENEKEALRGGSHWFDPW